MKKNELAVVLMVVLAASSCQNEEIIDRPQGRELRIEVSMGADSRTGIGTGGTMVWSKGDQIYVGNLEDKNTGGVLTLVSGEGTANAVFAGIVSGSSELQYSVYPVPDKNGNIDLTRRKSGRPDAPLISTFDSNTPGELKFNKTCGIVRVEVSSDNGGQLTLNTQDATGQKHLGGSATVVRKDGKYVLEYTRGEGGVTITDLPKEGYVDVPVITKAQKNGAVDNLDEENEIPLVIEIGEDEIEFEIKVVDGAVNATGVPGIDVNNNGVAVMVSTENELRTALEQGYDVKLGNNIVLNEMLSLGSDVTIYGENYNLSSSASRIVSLTQSDIKVVMEDLNLVSNAVRTETNDIRGIAIDAGLSNVSLELNNCTVDFTDPSANDWSYGVNIAGKTNKNSLTINGGSYEGANVINVWGSGHTITVNGATLTSLYTYNEQYYGVCAKLSANEANESTGNTLTVMNTTFNGNHAVSIEDAGKSNTVMTEGNTDNTRITVKLDASADEVE